MSKRMSGCRSLLLVGGVLLSAGAAQAVEEITNPVVGQAPVVTSVTINPSPLKTGDTVTGSWAVSDADGDDTSLTDHEWFLNDVPVTEPLSFPLSNIGAVAGDRLKLTVTPRTDPGITDPAIGGAGFLEVVIAQLIVAIGDFNVRTPAGIGNRVTYPEAEALCAAHGERLPSENELRAVRDSVNNGVRSNAFCALHGWPSNVSSGCSPAANQANFWSGTGFAGGRLRIDMFSYGSLGLGSVSDSESNFVVCLP